MYLPSKLIKFECVESMPPIWYSGFYFSTEHDEVHILLRKKGHSTSQNKVVKLMLNMRDPEISWGGGKGMQGKKVSRSFLDIASLQLLPLKPDVVGSMFHVQPRSVQPLCFIWCPLWASGHRASSTSLPGVCR